MSRLEAVAGVALAILIGLAITASIRLHLSADYAPTDTLIAILDDEARKARREAAAQHVCGMNSGYVWVDDRTVQCYTKRGQRTDIDIRHIRRIFQVHVVWQKRHAV